MAAQSGVYDGRVYWAYADVNAMMDFCEEMLRAVVFKVLGHTRVWFGDQEIDFGEPFRRVGMKESLIEVSPGEVVTNERARVCLKSASSTD